MGIAIPFEYQWVGAMPSWRRGICVVTVATVALAACSLGEKQARADRVTHAAVHTATAAGALSGTVEADLTIEIDDDATAALFGSTGDDAAEGADGPAGLVPGGAGAVGDRAVARFFSDPETGRALLGPTDGGTFPLVHFTDTLVALRPPDTTDTVRPWIAVGLGDLDDGSGAIEDGTFDGPGVAAGLLALVDPRLLLDLAAGPLAGSIGAGEADELDGVAVTRYEANFDIPRVLTDTREEAYDDDRLEVVETVLDLLNIDRDVNPGAVWIDDEGVLRRFDLGLQIEADDFITFDLELSMTVDPAARRDPEFALPTRDQATRVDSLLPLARAAAEAAAPADLGAALGG